MPIPSTLPIPSQDEGFKQEAREWADRIITRSSLSDVREALIQSFLTGGNIAFHMGYALGKKSK